MSTATQPPALQNLELLIARLQEVLAQEGNLRVYDHDGLELSRVEVMKPVFSHLGVTRIQRFPRRVVIY